MPKISDERKAEVRNQLIDAAIEVLLTEGPAATTTRRVLQQAGLSAGALYHYFASIDELYVAIAERFTDLDEPLFEPEPGTDAEIVDDPAEALVGAHLKVMGDLFTPGHHTILGQLRVSAMHNDGVRTAMRHYDQLAVDRAGALNRATQDVGLIRGDVDADALVEVASAFFEGFATRESTTGFATSRARVLRLFLEMLGERVVDPDHALAKSFRRRIEEISEP